MWPRTRLVQLATDGSKDVWQISPARGIDTVALSTRDCFSVSTRAARRYDSRHPAKEKGRSHLDGGLA